MLLSGGPPVPHPNLYDRKSSPQQARDYGSILGTPASHWAGSKQHCPIWGEAVSCVFIFVHSNAPRSLLCLLPVLDRCHPAVFAEREGCPYVGGWTTHADSSSLRNPLPDTHVPTGRACPRCRPGPPICLLAFVSACKNPVHPALWTLFTQFPDQARATP